MQVRLFLRCGFGLALCLSLGCHALLLGPPPPVDKHKKLDRTDKEPPPGLPAKHSLRVSQFVFLSDFELKANQPIFAELSNLRDQVHKELRLPDASTLVQVYLFENRDSYERYMHAKYPELPKRRAFFVAQPRSVGGAEDLLVYTYWGDRIREDLRHELTHALLHSVLKDVPLWLDEGLAEFFEVPPEWDGVNYQHLDQIRRAARGPFKPDLNRLEQLSQVQQMAPAEYREAWAWVHLMLRDKPEGKQVLLQYLQQLRTNPNPGPLQPRLAETFAVPDEDLLAHLSRLEAAPRPASATAKR